MILTPSTSLFLLFIIFCERIEMHVFEIGLGYFIRRKLPLGDAALIVSPFANPIHKAKHRLQDASQRQPYNACGPFGLRMARPLLISSLLRFSSSPSFSEVRSL